MIEQCRADEEAFLMALQREAAAVDHQLGALVDAHLDVILDARLVRGVDLFPRLTTVATCST